MSPPRGKPISLHLICSSRVAMHGASQQVTREQREGPSMGTWDDGEREEPWMGPWGDGEQEGPFGRKQDGCLG